MTLTEFIQHWSRQLPGEHFPHPRQTIRHLILHFTGLSQLEMHLKPERELSQQELRDLNRAAQALKNGKPLAYILGEISFLEWDFKSDSRSFIPRPETEALCAMVRERIRIQQISTDFILDMCCGSGVMGLSLALSFKKSHLVLADLSEKALCLARENTVRHHLRERVELVHSNLWEQIPPDRTFDILLCNPPYVAGCEHVDRQVLSYEPHMALYSEDRGLAHVKTILSQLDEHLRPRALAAFELGHCHSTLLQPWLDARRFEGNFTWEKDPFGVERFLFYRKL
ncbi:MAG: protein-(glutamine-N5) methyltransferase, release factor-specific [Acidobacteria bacterium]|nr:MAG: protein-(glutamine-N5) methyltransferase, release factor-specific [Acidobacteriota bacterium]PIE89966.1 MAG: protein-(glutamine-N5) methyltransferase, release factor-specific [Acidobacteriota bacterium]